MEYSFDIEVAQLLGVDEAILIKNLQFWIAQNKANNRNRFENRTWTYNSLEALQSLFPFWSVRQIKYLIQKLQKASIILVRQLKRSKGDNRNWYAFVDEDRYVLNLNSLKGALDQNLNKTKSKKDDLSKQNCSKGDKIVPGRDKIVPTHLLLYSDIKQQIFNAECTFCQHSVDNVDKISSGPNWSKIKRTFKDFKEKMEKKEVTGRDIHKLDLECQAGALLAFFSVKTGKGVLSVPSNIKPILGRLKDGLNENDIRCVMMMKFQEWKDDPKMNKFIRIETIFRPSKFFDYVSHLKPVQLLAPDTPLDKIE